MTINNNTLLRVATIDDVKTYFDWVNDTGVRQQSFNSQIIQWEDHRQWFQKKLLDHDCLMYVLEVNSQPIGQIRFDISDGVAHIDYSLDKDLRGKGLGRVLVSKGIDLARQSRKLIFQAEVKDQNIASARVFLKQGFEEIYSDNIEVKIFRLRLDG